jgi:hypothetical protein
MPLMKSIFLICFLTGGATAFGQTGADTSKCYVQVMIPADGALGVSRNIENNQVFMNGGMLIYTKAYAVKVGGRYVKFINPKGKELKNIWKPKDPEVMEYEW